MLTMNAGMVLTNGIVVRFYGLFWVLTFNHYFFQMSHFGISYEPSAYSIRLTVRRIPSNMLSTSPHWHVYKEGSDSQLVIILFFLDHIHTDFCGESVLQISSNTSTVAHSLPTYPYNYANNLDCIWFIDAMEYGLILVWFRYFHLETDADYLSIGKGRNVTDRNSTVLRLSGQSSPNLVMFNDTNGWIRFQTNAFGQWWGFFAYVSLENSYTFGEC